MTEPPLSISQKLRWRARSLLDHAAFSRLRRFYAGAGSALLYHRVIPDDVEVSRYNPYRGLQIEAHRFEEHLQYLITHFECLDIDTAACRLSQGIARRTPSVVVTFDDGYRDNLTRALPILERYEVPATIFVTTGLIDRSAPMWWDEQEALLSDMEEISLTWQRVSIERALPTPKHRYAVMQEIDRIMKELHPRDQLELLHLIRTQSRSTFSYDDAVLTWDEVLELDRHPLITIGAHTLSHPVLSTLSDSELLHEIESSKRILEDRLGHPVHHFAYPYGAEHTAGPREFDAVKRAGFRTGWTTRFGHLHSRHRDLLFSLPRIAGDCFDTPIRFARKLSGIDAMFLQRGRRVV